VRRVRDELPLRGQRGRQALEYRAVARGGAPREQRAERHAREAEEREDEAQPRERAVDAVQRAPEQHGASEGGHREDAQVHAARAAVGEPRAGAGPRDPPVLGGRRRHRVARRARRRRPGPASAPTLGSVAGTMTGTTASLAAA
jgi:hypothetical protein